MNAIVDLARRGPRASSSQRGARRASVLGVLAGLPRSAQALATAAEQ